LKIKKSSIVFCFLVSKILSPLNLRLPKTPCYSLFIGIVFNGELVMKNIELIADKELLVKMSDLSGREQKTTAEVVLYLNQIDQRKLYREAGYSSLFTYCREKLGYSEGAACRRITAARALNSSPELYKMLREGKMSLCAIVQISKVVTPENKDEIIEQSKGKSKLELQRVLSSFGELTKPKRESIRARRVCLTAAPDLFSDGPVGEKEEKRYSVTLELTEDEMSMVEEARKNLGKREMKEVLLKGAKLINKKKAPKVTAKVAVKSELKPVQKKESRYIPVAIQNEVRQRDKDQCTYCSPDGHRCTERYRLQFDHIKPFALGGGHEADNLRLLCPAHNGLYAELVYGRDKIKSYQRI